jgi:hypothetical protein
MVFDETVLIHSQDPDNIPLPPSGIVWIATPDIPDPLSDEASTSKFRDNPVVIQDLVSGGASSSNVPQNAISIDLTRGGAAMHAFRKLPKFAA